MQQFRRFSIILSLLTLMLWAGVSISTPGTQSNIKSVNASTEGIQTLNGPEKLAIYYGWPSLVNDADGDVNVAAADFANFDIVVLGDGLEHPAHGDHDKTEQIISQLVVSGTEVYGYIDMGVTTQNLSLATAQAYVDEWDAMGVTGIFWDDVGYDFGVDRARQVALMRRIRSTPV